MVSHGHHRQHPGVPQRTEIHLWDRRCNPIREAMSELRNSKVVAVIMVFPVLLNKNSAIRLNFIQAALRQTRENELLVKLRKMYFCKQYVKDVCYLDSIKKSTFRFKRLIQIFISNVIECDGRIRMF